jgi:hypothetical protein
MMRYAAMMRGGGGTAEAFVWRVLAADTPLLVNLTGADRPLRPVPGHVTPWQPA